MATKSTLISCSALQVINLTIAHAEARGHLARALKLTLSQLDAKPGSFDLETKVCKLMHGLGWTDMAAVMRRNVTARYPQQYEMF